MDNKELSGEEKLRQYIRENAELITRAQEELAKREELMKPMRLEDVKKQIELIMKYTINLYCYLKNFESSKKPIYGMRIR